LGKMVVLQNARYSVNTNTGCFRHRGGMESAVGGRCRERRGVCSGERRGRAKHFVSEPLVGSPEKTYEAFSLRAFGGIAGERIRRPAAGRRARWRGGEQLLRRRLRMARATLSNWFCVRIAPTMTSSGFSRHQFADRKPGTMVQGKIADVRGLPAHAAGTCGAGFRADGELSEDMQRGVQHLLAR